MKVDIEEISTVKRSIRIEVPPEVVAREFSAAYSDLNQRVRVPGFRPGKAPLAILEKRYGSTVEEDVIRRLVPDYYQRALKETGLRPVESPAIEKIELKKDSPLLFTAMVEVKPPIALGKVAGLAVGRQTKEVTQLDLDRALEALQDQQARLVACPEDRAIGEKDFVIIDLEGTVDGHPLPGGPRSGQLIRIGSGTALPGLEEGLIDHRIGETVTVKTAFPPDYREAGLAGRPVEFRMTIREVKEKVLPPIDDEFAKDVGNFNSLDELKTRVREDLAARLAREQARAIRAALLKQVVEAHPFEVPSTLVEREIQEAQARLRQRLPRGVTLEQVQFDPDGFRKEVEPAAIEKVKGRLILQTIADQEGLTVSREELDSAMARTAEELKLTPEDVRRLILSQEGTLDYFAERVREEKALDWVVSNSVEATN